MNICVDCGNTSIKFALFDKSKLFLFYSSLTKKDLGEDDLTLKIKEAFKDYLFKVDKGIISSVVPSLTRVIKRSIDNSFNIDSLILNKEVKTKLALKIDNPNELGSDFIATSIGALSLFKEPILIADLGTTTKISVIDKNRYFIGGMINSGLKISLDSLASNAAQLFEVPLKTPSKNIGKNTIDCINIGVILSQVYSILGFSLNIEKELGYSLKKILTGGYSELIKDKLEDFYFEKNLSLIGLNEILKLNS